MSLAVISLSALILALALSSISSINVGFLAIVLAWLVGVYAGGMTVDQVIAGFPSSLFLTLVGLTLLFGIGLVWLLSPLFRPAPDSPLHGNTVA